MKIITVNTEGKTYDISIESGLIKRLPEVLKNKYRDNKIALITDDNVFKLYGRDFCQLLQLEDYLLFLSSLKQVNKAKTYIN